MEKQVYVVTAKIQVEAESKEEALQEAVDILPQTALQVAPEVFADAYEECTYYDELQRQCIEEQVKRHLREKDVQATDDQLEEIINCVHVLLVKPMNDVISDVVSRTI